MRTVKMFYCVALLLSAAMIPAAARMATGTLEGTVIDAQGHALAAATVTIQTSYGAHPHVTHTDQAGHFAFTRFAAGQYDLRAYFKGAFSEWTKRVAVHSNKPTSITLRINR